MAYHLGRRGLIRAKRWDLQTHPTICQTAVPVYLVPSIGIDLGSLDSLQYVFAYFDDDPGDSERLPIEGCRSQGAREQYDGRPELGVVFGWRQAHRLGVVMDMDHTDLTCMNGRKHIGWSGG